ncbi:MAG: amino acid ABC transporter permease [Marinovum algicola]|jgi:general L-amino acid transport system permease protein|uniref:L-glutamine ABC transporter membrane protein /L-glutamate ABC transporter membrane protein /L-aspartate ABC transporter membrane protein /L-asparagine ABC transporter membrane protein n=2 Tax=Marinovum algicola TaxID=42444 RepID=A0A975W5X2_9RHOB|nr:MULTISPECIES: amino acid ABC transporter permease [Marinovum]AKO95684.1 amine acid ABC transporter, permease protein, 3-TM region, His/Glu/Gln/Arg/opine family [Marinovum algicola DG 898]MDD9742151.1 amino acid ABC transporter permease [Marinovum sp. SP66]MDD9743496.1 amino acid ABC transporter permease [Marinovum sp. PR37]SEI51213.1 L-glutamine ABC transporter membrane protein /L-glutamate ABC transporter membrane protein /L-aspartate ABC transporter membrane protein /L-asparagine ABC trans
MSDMHAHSVAFVRETMLPEQEPPASEVGVVHWMRENLFRGWANTLMTVIAIFVIYKIVAGAFPWFVNGIWSTNSLAECREILQGTTGGCFSVLTERWNQLLFGFKYPQDQYWRLILAFVLLGLAAAPVLFNKLPKQMLFFTGLYPFIGFWLIWGGTLLAPLVALAGFLVGFAAFKKVEHQSFAMGALAFLVAALVTWFLGGFAIRSAPGFLALEAVPSRDMGGFMLNMILGVVCVSLSLPFGILLALGRQSDMPIIKWICVVFIEFIRGVPLITLLFVANVVLAYFLPPGTTFDLIIRVIIMITAFASAYIAEVIRGGLAALPRGQYEAADSLGLDYAQATRLIIMPQALKISIPGIVNVAVGLFKDTTLVSVISMFDLVGMIRGPILASTEWNGVYWELWGFAVFLFFIVCYSISQYSQWLERQLQTDHR